MVERSGAPPMQKWEISFVWRSSHSWPGMASWEVREARHWVTLNDGSWWFQTVGRELCWRGQYGVWILSWGSRDSLWQDLSFIFLPMEGGSWEGECAKATTCEIILSRCTCTYNHNWKSRKSHYIWQETLLDMWAHLCVAYIALYVHVFACACVCISQHACVFSFGSVAAPDLLLLEDDYGQRKFPGR